LRKIVILVILFCFSVITALAQEQAGLSISEWLKGLQKKLEQIVPRTSVPVSIMVAGGHGAKDDTQPKLYWKGKKDDDAVTEEELTKFKLAINAVEKGDRTGAIKELAEFMKQYPNSALIPDAKKTLDLVKEEGK